MTLADLITFERKRWSGSPWRPTRLGRWLLAVIAVLWLVVSAVLARSGWMWMRTFAVSWLALIGILYAAPGLAAKAMVREWREDTVWWWLSLPAPREKLLLAKFTAILARWLRLWLLVFFYIGVYVTVLNAATWGLSWQVVVEQCKIVLGEGLLALALGPFLITIGMWMGIVRREARALIALMWLLLIGILNFQAQILGLKVSGQGSDIRVELTPNYFWIGLEFFAAYILAGVIFAGLVRWLKNRAYSRVG